MNYSSRLEVKGVVPKIYDDLIYIINIEAGRIELRDHPVKLMFQYEHGSTDGTTKSCILIHALLMSNSSMEMEVRNQVQDICSRHVLITTNGSTYDISYLRVPLALLGHSRSVGIKKFGETNIVSEDFLDRTRVVELPRSIVNFIFTNKNPYIDQS